MHKKFSKSFEGLVFEFPRVFHDLKSHMQSWLPWTTQFGRENDI